MFIRPSRGFVIVLFSSLVSACAAQTLAIGILGGAGLTDGFPNVTSPDGTRFVSTSKDYLIGPTIEWQLSPSWALEGDAIFRELHFGRQGLGLNGILGSVSPAPVVTWEFPVLAKYRFGSGSLHPFVEAGPSFRTAGNLNGANPSHDGITAGAGFEMRVRPLTLAPVLRYTRWMGDNVDSAYQPTSAQNQLELGVGASLSALSSSHPLGGRVSFGVMIGTGLTLDTHTVGFGFTSGLESYQSTTSSRRGVEIGPTIEVRLPASFSADAEAIYAPLRTAIRTTINGAPELSQDVSIGNWEVPILAKRRFHMAFVDPFVEAGPVFRVGTGEVSHYGVTGGLGVEWHVRRLLIAPRLRYSHWAETQLYQGSGAVRNKLEFFTAFAF
jgi:hypothetical protein